MEQTHEQVLPQVLEATQSMVDSATLRGFEYPGYRGSRPSHTNSSGTESGGAMFRMSPPLVSSSRDTTYQYNPYSSEDDLAPEATTSSYPGLSYIPTFPPRTPPRVTSRSDPTLSRNADGDAPRGHILHHAGSDSDPRDHPLYRNPPTGPGGLYHCPWEGDPSCNHKPEKLKCNYE